MVKMLQGTADQVHRKQHSRSGTLMKVVAKRKKRADKSEKELVLPDICCPNCCELEEGGYMARGCLSDKEFLAKLFLNEKGWLYVGIA